MWNADGGRGCRRGHYIACLIRSLVDKEAHELVQARRRGVLSRASSKPSASFDTYMRYEEVSGRRGGLKWNVRWSDGA